MMALCCHARRASSLQLKKERRIEKSLQSHLSQLTHHQHKRVRVAKGGNRQHNAPQKPWRHTIVLLPPQESEDACVRVLPQAMIGLGQGAQHLPQEAET